MRFAKVVLPLPGSPYRNKPAPELTAGPRLSNKAVLTEMSAKARVRETFAQFTPGSQADAAAIKKADAKPQQAQPKRKVARAHPAPQYQYGGPQYGRPMMVAQQPHFGLFNTTW